MEEEETETFIPLGAAAARQYRRARASVESNQLHHARSPLSPQRNPVRPSHGHPHNQHTRTSRIRSKLLPPCSYGSMSRMPGTNFQKQKLKAKLEDPQAFASTLFLMVLTEFGTDCFEWEPETLAIELATNYDADVPQVNRDKIHSLIQLQISDVVESNLEVFLGVCNALNNSEADFIQLDPPGPEELFWAIFEMSLHSDNPARFIAGLSDEIRRYIGVTLKINGIENPPGLLQIAIWPESAGIEQYADDPILYNAMWDKQRSESMALQQYVLRRAIQMLDDIASVPISESQEALQALRALIREQLGPDLGEPATNPDTLPPGM